MFVEERHNKIIELLDENGRIKVKDLSSKFNVSEDLIRKDLTYLENKGLLKKTYGGAIQSKTEVYRVSAEERKHINKGEKQRLAKKANDLIKENSFIFLDISTSSVEIAHQLTKSERKCTVVTNMIEVMRIIKQSDNIKLVFIGGEIDYGGDGFVGGLANELISKFKFDIAFLGVVAIDVYEDNVYTYVANDGMTKQHILKNSTQSYFLTDVEKYEHNANFMYAKVSDANGVITGDPLNDKLIKQLDKLMVKVI